MHSFLHFEYGKSISLLKSSQRLCQFAKFRVWRVERLEKHCFDEGEVDDFEVGAIVGGTEVQWVGFDAVEEGFDSGLDELWGFFVEGTIGGLCGAACVKE